MNPDDLINEIYSRLGLDPSQRPQATRSLTSEPLSNASSFLNDFNNDNQQLRVLQAELTEQEKLQRQFLQEQRKQLQAEQQRQAEQDAAVQQMQRVINSRVEQQVFGAAGIDEEQRALYYTPNTPENAVFESLRLAAANEELGKINERNSRIDLTNEEQRLNAINSTAAAEGLVGILREQVANIPGAPSQEQAREMLNAEDGILNAAGRLLGNTLGSAVGGVGDVVELAGALGAGIPGIGGALDTAGQTINNALFEQGEQLLRRDTAAGFLGDQALSDAVGNFDERGVGGTVSDIASAIVDNPAILGGVAAETIGALLGGGAVGAGARLATRGAGRAGQLADNALDATLGTAGRQVLPAVTVAAASDLAARQDADAQTGGARALDALGALGSAGVTGLATRGLDRVGLGTADSAILNAARQQQARLGTGATAPATGIVRDAVSGGVRNAIGEAGQELTQQLSADAFIDQQLSDPGDLTLAGTLGAAIGAATGAPSGVIQGQRARADAGQARVQNAAIDERAAQEAQAQAAFVEQNPSSTILNPGVTGNPQDFGFEGPRDNPNFRAAREQQQQLLGTPQLPAPQPIQPQAIPSFDPNFNPVDRTSTASQQQAAQQQQAIDAGTFAAVQALPPQIPSVGDVAGTPSSQSQEVFSSAAGRVTDRQRDFFSRAVNETVGATATPAVTDTDTVVRGLQNEGVNITGDINQDVQSVADIAQSWQPEELPDGSTLLSNPFGRITVDPDGSTSYQPITGGEPQSFDSLADARNANLQTAREWVTQVTSDGGTIQQAVEQAIDQDTASRVDPRTGRTLTPAQQVQRERNQAANPRRSRAQFTPAERAQGQTSVIRDLNQPRPEPTTETVETAPAPEPTPTPEREPVTTASAAQRALANRPEPTTPEQAQQDVTVDSVIASGQEVLSRRQEAVDRAVSLRQDALRRGAIPPEVRGEPTVDTATGEVVDSAPASNSLDATNVPDSDVDPDGSIGTAANDAIISARGVLSDPNTSASNRASVLGLLQDMAAQGVELPPDLQGQIDVAADRSAAPTEAGTTEAAPEAPEITVENAINTAFGAPNTDTVEGSISRVRITDDNQIESIDLQRQVPNSTEPDTSSATQATATDNATAAGTTGEVEPTTPAPAPAPEAEDGFTPTPRSAFTDEFSGFTNPGRTNQQVLSGILDAGVDTERVNPSATNLRDKAAEVDYNKYVSRGRSDTINNLHDAQERAIQTGLATLYQIREHSGRGRPSFVFPTDMSLGQVLSRLGDRNFEDITRLSSRTGNQELEEVPVVELTAAKQERQSAEAAGENAPGESEPAQGGQTAETVTPEAESVDALQGDAERPRPKVQFKTQTFVNQKVSNGVVPDPKDYRYFATLSEDSNFEYVIENLSGAGDLGYTLYSNNPDIPSEGRTFERLRGARDFINNELLTEGVEQIRVSPDGFVDGFIKRTAKFERDIKTHRAAARAANPRGDDIVRSPQETDRRRKFVEGHVNSLRRKLRGTTVFTFEGRDGLDGPLQRRFQEQHGAPLDNSVRGFFYNGAVYLNSEALGTREHIEETLAHEILGHRGLRNKFGANLNKELDAMTMAMGGVNGLVNYARDSGIAIAPYQSLIDQAIDTDNPNRLAARRQLAEELVALSMPNYLESSLMSNVRNAASKIRQLIINLFPNIADFFRVSMSPVDVLAYAARASMRPDLSQEAAIQNHADENFILTHSVERGAALHDHTSVADRIVNSKTVVSEAVRNLSSGRPSVAVNEILQKVTDRDESVIETIKEAGGKVQDRYNDPNNWINRLVRAFVDDLRVLGATSTEWSRRMSLDANSRRFTNARDKVADLDLIQGSVPTSVQDALKEHVSSLMTDGRVRAAVNIRNNMRTVGNRANFIHKQETASIRLNIDRAMRDVATAFSARRDGATTDAAARDIVNDFMSAKFTKDWFDHELSRPQSKLFSDVMRKITRSNTDSIRDAAKDIRNLDADQQGPALLALAQTGVLDGEMQDMRYTRYNYREALNHIDQMQSKHTAAQARSLEAAADALHKLVLDSESVKEQQGIPTIRDQLGWHNNFSKYYFTPSKTIQEVDRYSLSGSHGLQDPDSINTVNPDATVEEIETPMGAIEGLSTRTYMQREYQPIRQDFLINTIMQRAFQGQFDKVTQVGEDTGAFDGAQIRWIDREGDPEGYSSAVKRTQDPNGDSMLYTFPNPAEDGPEFLTMEVSFARNMGGNSVWYHAKSHRDELGLKEKIRNSDNLLVTGLGRSTQTIASMLTRYNLAHAPVSLVREMMTNMFVVMSNHVNTGRFRDDARESAKEFYRAASDTAQNAVQIRRYMKAQFELGRVDGAQERINKLIKGPQRNEVVAQFHEFVLQGGLIEQIREVSDENGVRSTFLQRILSANRVQQADSLAETLSAMTSMADAMGRFSSYRAGIALGMTAEEATTLSVGVADFNQRGESVMADIGALLFAFFRSGGVGGTQLIDNVMTARYGKEMAALGAGLGLAMFALGYGLSDEDEAGEKRFLSTSPSASSFTLYNPWTDRPVNVPVVYGSTGLSMHLAFQLMHGLAGGHDTATETAEAIRQTAFRQISPIDFEFPLVNNRGESQVTKSTFATLLPEAAKPLWQIALDMDGFGNSLTRRHPLDTSPSQIGGFADALSRASVDVLGLDPGNAWNSRVINHVMGSYAPAVGDVLNFITELGNVGTGASEDQHNWKYLLYPLNRFVGSGAAPTRSRRRFYEISNLYDDLTAERSAIVRALGRDPQSSTDRELAQQYMDLSEYERQVLNNFSSLESDIRDINTEIAGVRNIASQQFNLTGDGVGERRAELDRLNDRRAQLQALVVDRLQGFNR